MELTPNAHLFVAVLSFVVGSMIGSFLNVCVYRLPRGESIVKPRSKCPKCGNVIAWYDNFPMVSWLMLGAKCRRCGQPISWQYPLVEALTGTLFALVYLRFGWTIATPIYMALSAALVVVTFVDLTDWTIPNEITIPGVFVGIACALLGLIVASSGLQVNDPLAAILGALVGGGILYLLDKISLLILGKRGMGFGDVKLMAMTGAFFGWTGAVLTIVVAAFLGSGIGGTMILMNRSKKREGAEEGEESGTYLPFGPYLAAGAVVTMFFGPEIIDAYIGYLQTPGPMN